jgi:hypothetical protein
MTAGEIIQALKSVPCGWPVFDEHGQPIEAVIQEYPSKPGESYKVVLSTQKEQTHADLHP